MCFAINRYDKMNYKTLFLTLFGISLFGTSCFKDLDSVPLDDSVITADIAYEDPGAYKAVLAKLYAGLSVSGQSGPSGDADISGIDEGFGQYLRGLWYHQELSTDEAVIGWNDQTIKDFHEQDWDANDVFIGAFYSRIFYQISLANEFLRESSEEKLNSRGVDDNLKAEIRTFRAEARFLRALSYFHALDHFRNVPFVTEQDAVGFFFPEQTNGPELYTFIESELKDIENQLVGVRNHEYGRADQGAAWMLLAKLYLNAEVYAGKPAYSECIENCNKIINAGYELEPEYEHLFLADNHLSNEVIFPVTYDGIHTRTWGGTTFIIHATVGGNMNPSDYGIDDGWGGTRVTSALVNKYPAVASDDGGGFIVSKVTGEEYPEFYVPGNFVGWNPNDAPALTSPLDDGVYEGYLYFEAGDQFKFTPEKSFTGNLGDDGGDGTLEPNGDNIVVSDEGFYKIVLDINANTYTMQLTSWGLIGSATAGGWDSDTDMTYDAVEGAWVLEGFLNDGEIKFRANDDWAINYGDDGADAILEQEGENIAIASKGNYRIKLFLDNPDYSYSIEITSGDSRAMFFTDGQNLEIVDISQFTEGYSVNKFKNLNRDGSTGSNLTHPDTDFPMFRLADVHLIYAEAVLRGGSGGDLSTALSLVNGLRERAYGDSSGQIDANELTLDFILDERARELFWECHRRTDLIRFGQFSNGTYTWPWKGGVAEGTTVSPNFDLYPIPSADLGANINLQQNQGY